MESAYFDKCTGEKRCCLGRWSVHEPKTSGAVTFSLATTGRPAGEMGSVSLMAQVYFDGSSWRSLNDWVLTRLNYQGGL